MPGVLAARHKALIDMVLILNGMSMLFMGNVALFPRTFAAPETLVSFPIV
jgi:hypothetical protein